MSRLRWRALPIWFLASGFLLSCVVHDHREIREPTDADDDREEEADEAPPQERHEAAPAPRAGSVWVKGRWARRDHKWVWIVGHWRKAKAESGSDAVWVPGHWNKVGERKYRWVPGHWSNRPNAPDAANAPNMNDPSPDRMRPDRPTPPPHTGYGGGRVAADRHDPHEHSHPHPHDPGEHHHHEHVHPHQPGDNHHHPY